MQELPLLSAWVASEASLARTDRPLGPGELVAWQAASGLWTAQPGPGPTWVGPAEATRWRVQRQADSATVTATPAGIVASATFDDQTALLPRGESGRVALSLSTNDAAPPLSWRLHTDAGDLDPGCAPCWSETPVFIDPETTELAFPAWRSGPGIGTLQVSLVARSHADTPLLSETFDTIQTATWAAWGDPHVHTNLSVDGCEDPEDDCTPRTHLPGEDLFARAAEAGLHWAAITDHAEWSGYQSLDGDTANAAVDIWSATQALAEAAEGGPVLPLIGYEWTAAYEDGGHRTVVVDDLGACGAWRIPASVEEDRIRGTEREFYTANNMTHYATPAELIARFDELGEESGCAGTSARSWFHHPAYIPPRPVDWTGENNRDLGDTVVEILSEHGSSECTDPDAEGCDWRLNADNHVPDGSIRTALSLGMQLGFMGGSDDHMANPASLSSPGSVWSGGTIHEHFAPGAITGVLVAEDTLSRGGLFSAIDARHTVASSWRMERFVAALLAESGEVWLPGDAVPAGTHALWLTAEDEAFDTVTIELIDPDEGVVQTWTGDQQGTSITFEADSTRYLRLRMSGQEEEHRIFVSPWFVEGVEGDEGDTGDAD